MGGAVAAGTSLAALGCLDWATGPEIAVSILYVVPIGLSGWFYGVGLGLSAALAGAATWLVVDSHQSTYSSEWIGYWNAAVRLGFFILVVLLAAALRRARGRLQAALGERTAALERELVRHKRTGQALEEAQQRYMRAREMEAVGRLAAGVANDFRNDIALIDGNCELALEEAAPAGTLRRRLLEIRHACRRATRLTADLLSFGQRELLRPKAVSINEVVRGVEDQVSNLLVPHIYLSVALSDDAGLVRADPEQLSQSLVSVASHARDSMRHGGRLRVETSRADAEPERARAGSAASAGSFVAVTVSYTSDVPSGEVDTLFEPYARGRTPPHGTGLRLAAVYGFVAQSGGYVSVESVAGRGTSFRILLPRLDEAAHAAAHSPADGRGRVVGGRERVLVVDDDRALREMVAALLARYGYAVATADPAEAETADPGGIDLLLTDVLMAKTTGPELAGKLRSRRASLRVLYMSGYAGDDMPEGFRPDPGGLLVKPFSGDDLARSVRRSLDEDVRSGC